MPSVLFLEAATAGGGLLSPQVSAAAWGLDLNLTPPDGQAPTITAADDPEVDPDLQAAAHACDVIVVWNAGEPAVKAVLAALPDKTIVELEGLAALWKMPRDRAPAFAALGPAYAVDELHISVLKDISTASRPHRHLALKQVLEAGVRFYKLLFDNIDAGSWRIVYFETRIMNLTRRMNARGIGIDISLVRRMANAKEKLSLELLAIYKTATGYKNPNKRQEFERWLNLYGLFPATMGETDIAACLAAPGAQAQVVATSGATAWANIRLAVGAYTQLGRKSLSKLEAIQKSLDNGRIFDHLIYYGAITGRFSSSGVQVQSFPRVNGAIDEAGLASFHNSPVGAEVEWLKANSGELLPSEMMARMLRCVFWERAGFVWFDLAAIEARVLAYLAGEAQLLADFLAGRDIYSRMAGQILVKPEAQVTREERNSIGKPTILGAGYCLGGKAFAERNGVSLEMGNRAIRAFREGHPSIVALWATLKAMAESATAGEGSRIQLPSGCVLEFERWAIGAHHAVVMRLDTPDGAHSFQIAYPASTRWSSPSLTENICSRYARDILTNIMLEMEPTETAVNSVHDEGVYLDSPTFDASLAAALEATRARFSLPEGMIGVEVQRGQRLIK